MTIEFTTKEQRELKQNLMTDILQSAKAEHILMDYDDKEIGRLLFYHVWANMDVFTPQSALIEQAYLRLGFDPEKEKDK